MNEYIKINPVGGSGGGGVTYPLLAPNGTNLAPSYAFANSPDSGLYYDPGSNVNERQVIIQANGTTSAQFFYNGIYLPSGRTLHGTSVDGLQISSSDTNSRSLILNEDGDFSFEQYGSQIAALTEVGLILQTGESVVFGNSGSAWIKYSSLSSSFLMQSETDNVTYLNTTSTFGMSANAGVAEDGPYDPSFSLGTDTITLSNVGAGTEGLRHVRIYIENGLSDAAQLKIEGPGPTPIVNFGYEGNGASITSAHIQSQGSLPLALGTVTTPEVIKLDDSVTAGDTRMLLWDVDNGTLSRVSVGANDSGGVGYKVLRIPN
jgi:hypothetical protein